MLDKTIGFFGAGNMAEAIIKGMLSSPDYSANRIIAYDTDSVRRSYMEQTYQISFVNHPEELLQGSDYLFLAIKPQILNEMQKNAAMSSYSGIVISVIAGVSIDSLHNLFPSAGIVRTMPNMPALLAEGMTGVSYAETITTEQKQNVEVIFNTIGKVLVVKEEQLAAVTGVSGSGPAYVYMFAEAMADAAVLCGLSRDDAYVLVAQTLAGSARTLQETGKHPGELKDMVTSPGGTTIEAVKSLEANGFRYSVMDAVIRSCEKSKQL